MGGASPDERTNPQNHGDRNPKLAQGVVELAQPIMAQTSPKEQEGLSLRVGWQFGDQVNFNNDVIEELEYYGTRITDIHIKDRILGSNSVELGKGDADFSKFFNKLKEFDYKGPFIMQAYRDDEGVDIFKRQLDWIKPYLNE